MEGLEDTPKSEAHLTSAAAFVEGGIQEACDDACSICLEAFCDSDPSTLTNCKHEFHLQCILEWCQRSSQCPMCWQPIGLKDPTSQELLEAVERERSFRFNPSRNTTIFHHPTLGDFELQHLPVGVNDAELEERIIQHLAAAAAMGRRQIARRGGQRIRSSAQGRSQFLLFSNHSVPPPGPVSSSPTQGEDGEPASPITIVNPSPQTNDGEESSQLITLQSSDATSDPAFASVSGSGGVAANHRNSLSNRASPNHSPQNCQERAGPSDFQSFSESLKSKFNAVSTRYKESISKTTRGWREKFFPRNTTTADLGSEVRRDVNAGIATVSHMMERLETRDNDRTNSVLVPNMVDNTSVAESTNRQISEAGDGDGDGTSDTAANTQAQSGASSGSN